MADGFRRALGAAQVIGGDAVWRFNCGGVAPQCVVHPTDVDQVVAAVRVANAEQLAVVPSGNGTELALGWPPRRYDAAVSLRGLGRVVTHDADDMTVTAQAGVTLAELNDELGRAGQWLPLDPASAESITIGGLIAADRAGPQRLAYGKVRDYLLGVEIVTGSGTRVRGGGRVVKNVAGYDLPKLLVGSYGTLGVVVEATFKVRPRPAARGVFVWPAPSVDEAARRALRLLETPLCPAVLDVLNTRAAEAVGCSSGAALVIACAGSAAVLATQAARLRDVGGEALARCDDAEADAVLKALRGFPRAATDDTLVARVSSLPAALPDLLQRCEREAETRGVWLETAAHAGNGVVWCQASAADNALALALFAEWLRLHVRAADGWAVFEHVPPALRDRLDPWGFNERTLRLMLGIKRVMDPNGVLSPGRFVGGI